MASNMGQRRTGYCQICDANVVHVRSFNRRLAWQLDRLTLSILARFRVGPWQCVDCGNRQMFIKRREDARRGISERGSELETGDAPAAIGNFLRTGQALSQSLGSSTRYSNKYRAGVVRKLLDGDTTVSRVCRDLGVSELEIQQWIREWMNSEVKRLVHETESSARGLAPSTASFDNPRQRHDAPRRDQPEGVVIESEVVGQREKKPSRHNR